MPQTKIDETPVIEIPTLRQWLTAIDAGLRALREKRKQLKDRMELYGAEALNSSIEELEELKEIIETSGEVML